MQAWTYADVAIGGSTWRLRPTGVCPAKLTKPPTNLSVANVYRDQDNVWLIRLTLELGTNTLNLPGVVGQIPVLPIAGQATAPIASQTLRYKIEVPTDISFTCSLDGYNLSDDTITIYLYFNDGGYNYFQTLRYQR